MNPHNIKSYAADSMREALVMVRKDLGPDALIVSQETQGRKILLKATLEEWTAPAREATADAPALNEVGAGVQAATGGESAAPQPLDEPQPTAQAPRELLLDDIVTLHPRATPAAEPEPATVATTAAELANLSYPCAALTVDQLQGKFRFVGASGVGKTSLLIKILVEWVMIHGPADALVIANDNHRLGANEALQLTCQLLDVEITQSHHAGGAQQGNLPATQAKRLVLIDSSAAELTELRPVAGVRDVVVLSALHSEIALQAQLASLSGSQTAYLGLTHVDQAFDQSALAGFLCRSGLQPAFIGSSAFLPGGIETAIGCTYPRAGIDRCLIATMFVIEEWSISTWIKCQRTLSR